MNYTTANFEIFFFFRILTLSLCWDISDSIDKLNELNSCEIRRLNIDVAFGVVAVAADCFCYLDSERLPALFDHLFVRLPSLCLCVSLLYTRLSTHFSAVHSVVIVCVRDIRLFFKLLVKFEMY